MNKSLILFATLTLGCGTDRSEVNVPPRELFFIAVESKDTTTISRVINSEFSINQRSGVFRDTLLMDAINRPNVESIEVMLSFGANPRLLNAYCVDALTIAAGLGKTKICNELLQAGANPLNESCHHSSSAYRNAKLNNLSFLVDKIINAGAFWEKKYKETNEIFMSLDASESSKELIQKYKENLFATDPRFGDTLLIAAGKRNRYDLIEYLIEIPFESKNFFGETALNAAVGSSAVKFIEEILNFKPDLATRDMFERTPLHKASHNLNYEIVEFLLKNGSDPTLIDCEGESSFDIAIRLDSVRLLEALLEYKEVSKDALLDKARQNNAVKVIRFLDAP